MQKPHTNPSGLESNIRVSQPNANSDNNNKQKEKKKNEKSLVNSCHGGAKTPGYAAAVPQSHNVSRRYFRLRTCVPAYSPNRVLRTAVK
jgi:hypothetical protein